MALTVATLAQYGGIYVGDDDGTGGVLSAVDVANHTGEHLVSCRKWNWLGQRVAYMDLRGPISLIIGATDSTGTMLTGDPAASSFADYTFVPGDTVKVVSGLAISGVTYNVGHRTIAGKIDDDTLAMVDPVTTGGAGRNIVASIEPSTAAFPANFRSLMPYTSISDSNVLISGVELVSLDRLNRIRTNLAAVSSTGPYWGTVVSVSTPRTLVPPGSSSTTYYDAPQWVLEHHPRTSSTRSEALTVTYQAGWERVASDNDYIHIPEWLESAFIQLYKAFSLGYLEDDEAGTMEQRLAAWENGNQYKAVTRRDGAVQPAGGITRGGGAQRMSSNVGGVIYHPYPL